MSKNNETLKVEVLPLTSERVDDFFEIHSVEQGCGWCFCVAWWTPTWQGWGERTAEDNYQMRMDLFEQGHYDGYLAYVEGEPIGWCQVGRRSRLKKLLDQFEIQDTSADQEVWSITCFLVVPQWRRKKVATTMLASILEDLQARGVEIVEAYPKREEAMDDLDLWNGAESMYVQAGFKVFRDDQERPILRKYLL
ncbi:MAG: GNAT family N-acetyltransferase [Anaerolineales bacterium]|jgi:GNAT superfamily N-acetyltransferase